MTSLLRRAAIASGFLLALPSCEVAGPIENLGESVAALNANDKTAYDYFIGKGLTGVQAAGIVGNLDIESGMDPAAVQSGGPGRGIAQWSVGARWDVTAGDNVKAYASMHGMSATSLGLQLDFIWFELTTFSGYGLAKLKAATTVNAAVNAFMSDFEGCGACDASARVTDAQKVYAAYGSDVPSDGGLADAGPSCTVASTGETGECITTAACAALGDHVSTPGLCPGAADVQCCTLAASGGGGGGGSGGGGSGGSSSTDGGGGHATDGSSSGGCNATGHGSSGPLESFAGLAGLVALFAYTRRRQPRGR